MFTAKLKKSTNSAEERDQRGDATRAWAINASVRCAPRSQPAHGRTLHAGWFASVRPGDAQAVQGVCIGLVLLALAGCAGGDGDDEAAGTTTAGTTTVATTTATSTEPDATGTPGEALDRFVRASGDGDPDAMWAELSAATRERYVSLEDFRNGGFTPFAEGVGSYARSGGYETVLDETVGGRWGVAAITGEREVEGTRERGAYAAAAVVENGEWKLELAGGGAALVPVAPTPSAASPDPDSVSARVEGKQAFEQVHLWVDDRELEDVAQSGDTFSASAFELAPGPHVAVAFAVVGGRPVATAWAFENAE